MFDRSLSMEPLSPRSPSSPSSPRRHIHSSFPHYFYSTPAAPASSDSLSAFVVLCESRLSEQSNSSDAAAATEFAFRFNRSTSFDVAFAEDIFHEGRLLPIDPAAAQPAAAAAVATSPLKPPPRLQYIANIRKSLRIRKLQQQQQAWKVAGRRNKKDDDDDDPFVLAVEKVTREDAPWCQLPRGRRSKVRQTDHDDDVAKVVKRRGIVECVKSAILTKRNKDVLFSKEEESAWLIRKSRSSKDAGGHGKFVGLARCTTVSRYKNTHYGSSLLACFGFK